MSVSQKEQIKKYFNLLVQEFIKDPNHKKNITIVFKDYLGGSSSGDTLGHTEYERTGGREHWQTLNRVEVPGSRWQEPFKYTYTITFLNHYQDQERWRGTVAHEFAHLYLFSIGDSKHAHDDNFYSKMDYFENWLDQNQGLTPRQDKSGDWQQHIDYNKRKRRQSQIPNQPTNGNYSPPPHYDRNESGSEISEQIEFNQLRGLIQTSQTLTELKQNYRTVKNSPLYSSSKKTFGKSKNNEEILDSDYNTRKGNFCPNCLNPKKNHQSNCPNKRGKCNDNSPVSNLGPITNQEQREFHRLIELMKNSKSLAELEQNYQVVKNSFIYNSNTKSWESIRESNQAELDARYKDNLQKRSFNTNNYRNDFEPESSKHILWIGLVIGGGAVIGLILLRKIFRRKKRKK